VPTLVGTQLDKYQMLEEVGHGGMAVVYRASDRILQREVAVKVLHAHLADREESKLRLQREAIAVAKLRHDNILEIFDYSGPEAGESYIVTEFIHGPTLREWIDDSLEPRPAIAALVIHRLCLALAHAHRSGIIHRDIKPENVMIRLEDGCIKLMDFGIAQLLDNQKITMTGQLIGSPAYMAPELISGRPLDARTDLFSLGIILYQLATGELPFSGRNPHEVLNRISDGDYPAPSSLCSLVDRDLETIIATALATSPNERYQTVDAFAKELELYLAELGIEAAQAELAQYFRNPTVYVQALDQRVCTALLRCASEAAKSSHTGRAIRYLGRVLEIDSGHRDAKAMLERLRTRERRTRQALLAAGVVAAGGLVTAGLLLLPPDRAEGQPVVAAHRTDHGLHQDVAAPAVLGTSTTVTPARGPRVPADRPPPELTPASATAPLTDSVGQPPSDVDASEARDERGEVPAPRRKPRKDARLDPPPVIPSDFRCVLRLEGIPISPARNVKISVNQGPPIRVDDPHHVEVEVETEGALAVLRSDRWRGHTRLTHKACSAGPVVIVGTPRPAQLTFSGAPASTSVRCVAGCPRGYSADYASAEAMPPMALAPGQNDLRVTLHLAAKCHEQKTVRERLDPGPNEIAVALQRIPQCTE